jgi:hypothetical protein
MTTRTSLGIAACWLATAAIIALLTTPTADTVTADDIPHRILTVNTNGWAVNYPIHMASNTLTIGAGGLAFATNAPAATALGIGSLYMIDTGAATQLVWIVAGVTNVIDPDGMTP